MSVAVERAREEWAEGHGRLEAAAGDRRRYVRLLQAVEAVVADLRRRVGQTYTLADLARAYDEADRWSRDVVEDVAPTPDWPRTVTLVTAAAFHLYSRGAVDYAP